MLFPPKSLVKVLKNLVFHMDDGLLRNDADVLKQHHRVTPLRDLLKSKAISGEHGRNDGNRVPPLPLYLTKLPEVLLPDWSFRGSTETAPVFRPPAVQS